MGVLLRTLTACLALAAAGCAAKAVILAPVPVPMPSAPDRTEGPLAWSLWVAEARDVRPPDQAGQKLGTLYTRFENTPQAAFLDRNPSVYVREQLSRFLLHRGLEASAAERARVLLAVDLEECSLVEVPGAVWDELTVRVGYTVRMNSPSGQELGRVKLGGETQVKSPLGTDKQAAKALADALADTFNAFTQSEAFQTVTRTSGR